MNFFTWILLSERRPSVLIWWLPCRIFFFFPLEVLRIAWPLSEGPAGTLDMSSLFEDKSSLDRLLGDSGMDNVEVTSKSQPSERLFLKPKTDVCSFFDRQSFPSASANTLPVVSVQPTTVLLTATVEGPAEPASRLTPGNQGQHFSWHASSVMNWREWKGREWNGEKKREQEKELIFLTPAVRHRDVWACLPRIGAARKRSIVRQDLSSASDVTRNIQFVSGNVSMMSTRRSKYLLVYFCCHIFMSFLLHIQRLRCCAYVSVWVSRFLRIDCWFSWSLLNAWQPTDILCHWALVCNHDSISPGNQGRAREWKNTHQGQAEWRAAEQRLAGLGGSRAPAMSFKLHPSCSKISLESTVCVNMRNPLGWVDFNKG